MEYLAPEKPLPLPAAPLPELKDPETIGDGEADGDYWGALSRVELSRYIARRGAELSSKAENSRQDRRRQLEIAGDWASEVPGAYADEIPGFEHTDAWSIVLDALQFERQELHRGLTSAHWPDALWSPECLGAQAAKEFDVLLTKRVKDLETLADERDDATRAALHALPVGVHLRQLLCDTRCAAGNLTAAAEALAGAVVKEQGADPLCPPMLFGWEGSLDCKYLRAQHCLRLGRLAVLGAVREVAAAEAFQSAGTALDLRKASLCREASRKAATAARRLLKDARKLYEEEISSLGRQQTLDLEEEWSLALRCGRLLTMELQSQAAALAGEVSEVFLQEAIDESIRLQADDAATQRLQRLLSSMRHVLTSKLKALA